MHKVINKYLIIILTGVIVFAYTAICVINYNKDIKITIKDYYNDPLRPAFVEVKWPDIEDSKNLEIIKTPSNFKKPKYSVIYASDYETDTSSVDVISFKRDLLFNLYPVDLIHSNMNLSFEESLKLAKEKDISQINAGLKEDDPRYDKNIKTFKNPTKEEWMQKLEDQKAKLFHSIPNPSGTDALEYYSSKAYEGEPSFFSLKSENKVDIYKKYFITFNTPYIKDFSVWINDDEFICDVQKPSDEYSDPITQTKEYKEFYENHKEGVYVFNKNTKSFRLFADIKYNNKKGEHYVSYFLTHAKNIVVQSNTTIYEYDRNGNFMSSQKIPDNQ